MSASNIAVVAGVILTAVIAVTLQLQSHSTADQHEEAPWTSTTGGAWYTTAGMDVKKAAYRQLHQQLRSPLANVDHVEEGTVDGLRGLMVIADTRPVTQPSDGVVHTFESIIAWPLKVALPVYAGEAGHHCRKLRHRATT